MFVSFFRIISEAVPCDNQKRLRTLASYQRPFRMKAKYNATIGQWFAYVAKNYGDVALQKEAIGGGRRNIYDN